MAALSQFVLMQVVEAQVLQRSRANAVLLPCKGGGEEEPLGLPRTESLPELGSAIDGHGKRVVQYQAVPFVAALCMTSEAHLLQNGQETIYSSLVLLVGRDEASARPQMAAASQAASVAVRTLAAARCAQWPLAMTQFDAQLRASSPTLSSLVERAAAAASGDLLLRRHQMGGPCRAVQYACCPIGTWAGASLAPPGICAAPKTDRLWRLPTLPIPCLLLPRAVSDSVSRFRVTSSVTPETRASSHAKPALARTWLGPGAGQFTHPHATQGARRQSPSESTSTWKPGPKKRLRHALGRRRSMRTPCCTAWREASTTA